MSKLSRNMVIGGLVLVIGLVSGWLLFGSGETAPTESGGSSILGMHRTEAMAGRGTRTGGNRAERPEDWKWSAGRRYSTLGDNDRIGRDVLELAGLQLEDGPRVKAVFERAFQKVEAALTNQIQKTETVSDGTSITEVFQIKGDTRIYDEAMKSLREDLIANFGNSAAKKLYEGFQPDSKYGGMGRRDMTIKKRSIIVPAENTQVGSFNGDMYGKKEGDAVITFEGQFRRDGTEELRPAFGCGEKGIRSRYGNLVSHFGL